MNKIIDNLCKNYLPSGRDLSTFNEEEILHLEMAFIQGANVMMDYLKEDETSEANLNIADVSNCFTAKQMAEAFANGEKYEACCGDGFDINNYC